MFFCATWNDALFKTKYRNMKFLKVTILVFIVVAFTSCKCLHHVQGIVIDSETRLPIDNVVVKESGMYFMHTDSCGNFEITSMTGGIFGCPKISLSLEKEGYNKVKKNTSVAQVMSLLL